MKLIGLTRGKLWKQSTRRKLVGALGLLLAIGLLVALTLPALAVGELPHQFWGDVFYTGGTPVPAGTEIKAVVHGVEFFVSGGVDDFSRYGDSPNFFVQADNLSTPEIEGGQNGDTISFYVGGIFVTTFTFQMGAYNELDLEVPADIPPTVVSTLPVDEATGVALNATVSATFSENIQEGDNFGDIAIGGATGVSASIAGDTLTIAHDDFTELTAYVVTIPAGAVKDMTDNPLAADYTWNFTTGTLGLSVVSTMPADGTYNVALDATVSATFSENIQPGANFGDIAIGGATGVSASIAGDTLTIAHDNFADDTAYMVTIPAGAVEDLVGTPLASDYTWNFSTGPPTTLDLIEGVNIIAYTGATTSLPEALTNIGPSGLDVVDGLWARGAWTGGEWLYYNARIPYGTLSQLEAGNGYIIVVTEDCTWSLP
jgi:methionine-rich copper-binding protein CopC